MDKDIVPSLLELIETDFDESLIKNEKIRAALKALKADSATYVDANDFAVGVGETLAKVLQANVSAGVLPDDTMYYNIAERILNSTLQKNHDLISNYAIDVQTVLNQKANLRLKAQRPDISQDRIDGLINKITSYDEFESAKWLLDEPVINFSQSIIDDSIKSNVEFHLKSGLQPHITRTVVGHSCDWCKSLAGTYAYPFEVPDDIYRRHERCRCIVEYNPKNSRRTQNVHTKKWQAQQKRDKIEERKKLNNS